jgi:signal transduction histidine kinase/CheY-like chemotaxis protein
MKKPSFEVKIIAIIMLAAVVFVSAVGYLAYARLNNIATSLLKEARPDLKLVILKGILYDLSNAESHIKSYSLTKDDIHLEPYYFTISQIDDKIDALNAMSDTSSMETKAQIDSIGMLIEKKFLVWDEMLQVSQNDPLKKVLTQIKNRIEYKRQRSELEERLDELEHQKKQAEVVEEKQEEKPSPQQPREAAVEESKKSNIFKRLFGKKMEEPPPPMKDSSNTVKKEPTTIAPEESQADKNQQVSDSSGNEIHRKPIKVKSALEKGDIQKEIALIERKQGNLRLKTEARQLQIIEEDKIITNKIHLLISALERKELRRFENRALIVDQQASSTNLIIGLFCIATALLLFVVFYFLLRYVRKTAAYQKALRKAKAEAENLAATKEQFMANMSHEIRTPMNSILGFTEQALKQPSSSTQDEQLQVVKRSSEHLMQIINDILDFSKLEAAKLTIDQIEFKPASLVNETFQMLAVQAERKGLSFNCKVGDEVPEVLLGDPLRLKQILVNLAGNAIKFTEKGGVDIEVSAATIDSSFISLQLKIRDSGIGIPSSRISSVFEDFMQADIETTRTFGGTGLGLAIAKRLVEQQNGQIHVESEYGKGSTFSFKIPYPIAKTPRTNHALQGDSPRKHGLDQLNVLLVDDEEYNRLLLKTILKSWGTSFHEVVNGKEAVEAIKTKQYDLVLMDVRMPVMDGLTATQHIRNELSSQVPIIALTAATSKEDVQRCLDAGMNDFLSKPFTEAQLHHTLINILPAVHGNVALLEKEESTPPEAGAEQNDTDAARFNIDSLIALASGDHTFVLEMLRTFMYTTVEGIEEIEKGIAEKNWKKVADHAHKIASPCRHLEAHRLLQLLKEMEHKATQQEELESLENLAQLASKEAYLLISDITFTYFSAD